MRDKPLILVVDDEPDLLEIMSEKLRSADFDPVVAHNAKEAVDAAGKLHPDLILMDIKMAEKTRTPFEVEKKQKPKTKENKKAILRNNTDPWHPPDTHRQPGVNK